MSTGERAAGGQPIKAGQRGRSKRRLWVLVWPDTGRALAQNPGVPCAFFSREDARRWKRNHYYKTPLVVPVELLAERVTHGNDESRFSAR
jgi:hypothetical protein